MDSIHAVYFEDLISHPGLEAGCYDLGFAGFPNSVWVCSGCYDLGFAGFPYLVWFCSVWYLILGCNCFLAHLLLLLTNHFTIRYSTV